MVLIFSNPNLVARESNRENTSSKLRTSSLAVNRHASIQVCGQQIHERLFLLRALDFLEGPEKEKALVDLLTANLN
jgi:hypothetical protein